MKLKKLRFDDYLIEKLNPYIIFTSESNQLMRAVKEKKEK